MTDVYDLLRDGAEHHRSGQLADAKALYLKVLAEQPDHPDALHLLGGIAQQSGDATAAESLIRRAIAAKPDAALFHNNLGKILAGQKRWLEASACFRRAVELQPSYADADSNLGAACIGLGDRVAAEAAYRRAVEVAPDDLRARRGLGVILEEDGRFPEAAACFEAVLAAQPDDPEMLMKLGFTQEHQGQVDEAIRTYRKLISLRPDLPRPQWNLATLLLLRGDFAAGWTQFEWRFATGIAEERHFAAPLWDGSDICGRTIFLYPDQGFGDQIQFVRYVSLLAARGAKVVLEAPPALQRLFQGLSVPVGLIEPGERLPPIDCHAPLLSLPLILGTRLDTIPASVPYLSVGPELRSRWQERIGGGPGLRVGLVWAGNPAHVNDVRRSMSFDELRPLLAVPDVRFFSLQVGETARPLPGGLPAGITDLAPLLTDFAETAAALTALDLVIAVDTAVIHVAGSLARPGWLLLPFHPDWRWLRDRADSPWYPSLRLFRQPRRDDWASVVTNVTRELTALAAACRSQSLEP